MKTATVSRIPAYGQPSRFTVETYADGSIVINEHDESGEAIFMALSYDQRQGLMAILAAEDPKPQDRHPVNIGPNTRAIDSAIKEVFGHDGEARWEQAREEGQEHQVPEERAWMEEKKAQAADDIEDAINSAYEEGHQDGYNAAKEE